ncbi:GTP-binding protein [Rhizoctonia solani]|uniref:GTP-binding protein n=1 Tax=Rhizoctonia solani TaxID=456999 RepID=A0A8H8P5S2_9AGAM|nr:GTP-binding protein [Rhizoctonia solani]QRW25765.1 GTP-binding protein [Rhizoctonia solani]
MTAALEPSIGYVKRESKSMYPAALKSMIGSTARPIFLGELTGDQLRILSEHGLREAYSTPFIRYEKQMEEEEKGRNREYEESIKKMKDSMKQDERQLKRFISLSVRDCYSHLYPSLWISGFTPDNESLNWGHLREKYIELENVPQSIRKNLAVGNIDDPEFKDLKLAWHTIQDYLLQDPTPSPALQAEFIAEVLGSPSDGEWTVVTKGKGSKHAPKLSWKGVKKVVFDFFGYKAEPPATLLSDMEFIRALRSLADKFPVTSALTDRITTCLKTYLSTLSERLVKSCLEKVEEEEERRLKDLIDRQRQHRFRTESSATERRLLNDLRVAMASNNPFIHLVRDKCLVIIAGPSQFDLYIEDNLRLPRVIAQNHPKRSFKYDRLGDLSQCRFAFDESTRLLALFHNSDTKGPELTMFGFDETFTNVHLRGSPFVLKDWYENEVHVDRICFVSGTEEICLIETSGQARVLSMVTLNFRPASIQISGRILDAFSAPDGSCLLVLVMEEPNTSAGQKLLVFHWASFGATQNGINPIVLPPLLLAEDYGDSVYGSSNQTEDDRIFLPFKPGRTDDCIHRDVAPAVIRSKLFSLGRESRKLVFASASSMVPMNSYFSRMITKFERTTCKPINAELKLTYVAVFSDPLHISSKLHNARDINLAVSSLSSCASYRSTKDNRFIPLKDGVCDPEYERSLLGADVPAIIDSLSIGWYESLFQSYMANKPVKVVSSMGEQSVGKSYCLNHFADTSFAGSAMRTTEGVWLSCTPTDDYLLVSLDFEGFHSIERTPQEDALLVLFNTAISNLVLFRNNFAFSRDIAGLFQSFQSSAMVLDPDSSPSLFNSTLAIIIKDVTDSDSKDIVKEFSLKFQRIVQKEQEQNFISRLHRGKVQIIPWPVINSSSFYTLFNHLRRYLDGQPVTHTSGGIFLHNMKTMMAKIKANDWSSLDQNLATHRAQQINKGLNIALSQGSADTDTHMPLKNLDTDEDLPINGPSIVFFVPDASATAVPGDDTEKENALENLINFCLAGSNIGSRHIVGDAAYIRLIQEQLFKFLEQRLEYVRSWVQVNVQRFPAQFNFVQKPVLLVTIVASDRTDI